MAHKEIERFSDSTIFEGLISIKSVIEGNNIGSNDRKIEKVLFDKNKISKKMREFSYLQKMAEKHAFDIELADTEAIEKLALGTTHGGIIAFCTSRTLKELSDIKENGFYVMIEGIEDPYNFGYAIRSLYASGVDGIILSPRNWMGAAGVVCRSSAGASEMIDIYISDPESAALKFKNAGYKIVCADIENSVSAYDADLSYPLFLIVGGEKRGISRSLLNCCDTVVRLDYGRPFKNALSAASAASVLAFEIFRQNRK